MTDRIRCCVEQCRRSFKPRADDEVHDEIMCGRCFRTADGRLILRYRLVHARSRRALRLLRLKSVQAKRGYRVQFEVLQGLFLRAHGRAWAALKEDVEIKSRMRVEGTAGALAARRAA